MAKNSFIPTQIGHTQKNGVYASQVVIGRDVSSSFEAAGIGEDSRPDELEKVIINITNTQSNEKVLSLTISITDILSLKAANVNTPTNIEMLLKQVSVCEINDVTGESEEKGMIVLASQTFSL